MKPSKQREEKLKINFIPSDASLKEKEKSLFAVFNILLASRRQRERKLNSELDNSQK